MPCPAFRDKCLNWLLTGRVGVSSKAICAAALGVAYEHMEHDYPRDLDDFNRCLLMIDATGADISVMGDKGPIWAAYVRQWAKLKALFEAEVGPNWSQGREAVETYRFIQALIRQ